MSAQDKERMTAYRKDPFSICIVGGKNCPEGGGPNDTDATSGQGYDAGILAPLLEEDVLDVMNHGILQSVLLRKNGPRDEVQAGRTRIRWAREAQRRTGKPCLVPCIFKVTDDKGALMARVSENTHRKNLDFETKARLVLEMTEAGCTDEDIRITIGCTSASVENYKKYFSLSKEVQDAVRAGDATSTAMIQLASLPREVQTAQLSTLKAQAKAKGKRISVADARKAVQQHNGHDVMERPKLRVLKKVIAHEKADDLPEGFVLACRWFMGDVAPEKIRGLKGILKELFVVAEE